ncbi:MAG: phosphatase PAP2 family protein [Candidatus Marinimicrobia bacterium]|nr:phosphatase PAP2 family protein [Candidatus Neomarinimicrobiota bacterium]
MKKLLIIFLVIISFANAQQLNGEDYFRYAMPEVAKTWEGYVILGSGAALSGLALMADKSVRDLMIQKAYLPSWLDHMADKYVDHYWAFGVSALGALGYGYKTGNYGESFRYWAASNLGTIALTYALKYSIGRLRPNEKDHKSYPSGHTSVAFATATMYQMWYGWKGGIPAYTFAAITAFQRLDDDQHWLSDVIMGAAIGIAVPYMFYKGEEKAKIDQGLIIPPLSISIPLNFPVGK